MSRNIQLRLSFDSLFRTGYFYQLSGDFQVAAAYYIRSIEKEPSPEAHTFLGWVLGQMGHIEEAIKECKRAVKLDPEFGNAWNDMGTYFMKKRKLDQAILVLKKACKAKNYADRAYPHFNLARVYIQKGMLLAGRKELMAALKIKPEFISAKETLKQLENLIQ